jgi:dipeptidyl aminopeptidase/acylaminoacyl peptidase
MMRNSFFNLIVCLTLLITFMGCVASQQQSAGEHASDKIRAQTQVKVIEEKLTFETADGLILTALMARPAGEGPFPAVMINHGSSGPTKEWQIWTSKLAEKGYVTLALIFRGFKGSEGTETYGKKEVEDILLVLDYVKSLPFVDKKRIGMFGNSKGGFNALLASTRTSDLKAIVVWGAWADMVAAYRYSLEQQSIHPSQFMRDAASRHVKIIGGKPEDVPEEWKIRSAINYVDNITAAVLILHGGNDSFAAPEMILPFAETMKSRGKNVNLKVYPGQEHMLFVFTSPPAQLQKWAASRNTANDVWVQTTDFLDKNLKPGQ